MLSQFFIQCNITCVGEFDKDDSGCHRDVVFNEQLMLKQLNVTVVPDIGVENSN